MSQPILYKKLVAISPQAELKVQPIEGYSFARPTNVIPLAAIEFAHAAREFPIAFVRNEQKKVSPVAVVGLQTENVYVDEQGNWLAAYIPAYIRRYPFHPARGEGEHPILCIDEGYQGYNSSMGEPLFDQDNKPTTWLAEKIKLVSDYQGHLNNTDRFCQTLEDNKLLRAVTIESKKGSQQPHKLTGLEVVDENKLQKLAEKKVLSLFNDGFLLAIYSHLISQANFQTLVNRTPADPDKNAIN